MSTDINAIIKQREKTHGAFVMTADTAQLIKTQLRTHPDYQSFPPYLKEGFDMIASKLGRICNGQPLEVDHWVDIAGYATLVAEYLKKDQELDKLHPQPSFSS